MTVVQNTELSGDGDPIEGVIVTITTTSNAASTDNGTVVAPVSVKTGADGVWSVDLIPTTSINPAGTAYKFSRKYPRSAGGKRYEAWGTVPPSSSAVNFVDIIVTDPEAYPLSNSELDFLLTHTDPFPQYLTQTEGDSRYAASGSSGGGTLPTSKPHTFISDWDDAVRAVPIDELAPPIDDLAMGSHKITGGAKATAPSDFMTLQNQLDHKADTNDPHAAAKYAIMPNGRRIWVQETKPSIADSSQNDVLITKTDGIWVRDASSWVNIEDGEHSGGTPTDPQIPNEPTDIDRKANVNDAIDQFFAEFVDSEGRVIPRDEDTGHCTSEGQSYAMLMAVLAQDQAKFDLVRAWGKYNMARSLNSSLTRGKNLWAQWYTLGQGVTGAPTGVDAWDWDSAAEYDRAIALARACQLWNRQRDYQDLNNLAADLKAYTLNTDENRKYQTSNGQQQQTNGNAHHGTVFEVRPGAINPIAYRVLKSFTTDTTWDAAINGAYDLWTKNTNATGGVPTSAGLWSDYVSYNTTSHDAEELTNGSNGWTITRSRNYSYNAVPAPIRCYMDYKLYNETRARQLLTGNFQTWAQQQWAGSTKFVTSVQQSNGAALNSTKKLQFAYAGYFALVAEDPNDAIANDIKETWGLGDLSENSYGKYFNGNPSGTSQSSAYYSNAWMIFAEALDAGMWVDVVTVPGIAGKYVPPTTGGDSTPTDPGTGTNNPTTPLPAGAVKLAVDTGSLVQTYATSLPAGTKKNRFQWLAGIPQCMWTGPEWDADGTAVQAYINVCAAQDAWFMIAMYGIPGRDMGGASAGGSVGASEYRAWSNAVLAKFGQRPGIVIIEPDSIAQMVDAVKRGEKTQADFNARMALINELVTKIRAQFPNIRVYLDAAHAAWKPDPTELIPGLRAAGVEKCHGFCSNVSNFRNDADVVPWSQGLLAQLNIPAPFGYVWDTGRNGKTPPPDGGDWQNPLQTRFGRLPQYGGTIVSGDPRAHGALWIKRPGESDGNDPGGGYGPHGGPPPGQLWVEYLFVDGRADEANGNPQSWHPDGGNAGMLQRTPTPGVGSTQTGTVGTPVTPTPGGTTPSWYSYGTQPSGITLQQTIDIFKSKYATWKADLLTQSGMPGGMPAGAWRVKVPDQGSAGYTPSGQPRPLNLTFSEGIGYAMFILAYASRPNSPIYDSGAKAIFDGLWTYYKFYRDANGLMNWLIYPDGSVQGTGGATDGDEDVAIALVLMHRFVGSAGSINYGADATTLINKIRDHEFSPVGHSIGDNIMLNGDQWDINLDRYMPDYFAPAWYREFQFHTSDSRWTNIINVNYPKAITYFYNNYPSGYVPDQSKRDSTTLGYAYNYGYNAIRMPWRVGADYLWNNNSTAGNNLAKLANSERNRANQVPANARAERDLSGNNPATYINKAYISGFGLAGVADASAAVWARDCILWLKDATEKNYFGQNLELIALLALTGEMKPYRP